MTADVSSAQEKCTTVGVVYVDIPLSDFALSFSLMRVTTMNTKPVSAAADEPVMT